jgi:excisionase family DNA binding protein
MPKMTDEESRQFLAELRARGWLPDILEQMDADHRQDVRRVYVLTIDEAAEYLGVSRHAINKLIGNGRLRLMAIAPSYTGDKPKRRIRASDLLKPS